MAIKLTPDQQKALVAGVLMLGAFGYLYMVFFWLPVSGKIKNAADSAVVIEGKIQKAQQQAGRLSHLQKDLVSLNEQAVEAEKRLPKSKDVADILVTLGALASKYNIDLLSLSPGATSGKQYFTELNYPMSVKGSYHDIGRFFAALALAERIFNIQNVVFTEPDASGVLTVSFTLISYQYKG